MKRIILIFIILFILVNITNSSSANNNIIPEGLKKKLEARKDENASKEREKVSKQREKARQIELAEEKTAKQKWQQEKLKKRKEFNDKFSITVNKSTDVDLRDRLGYVQVSSSKSRYKKSNKILSLHNWRDIGEKRKYVVGNNNRSIASGEAFIYGAVDCEGQKGSINGNLSTVDVSRKSIQVVTVDGMPLYDLFVEVAYSYVMQDALNNEILITENVKTNIDIDGRTRKIKTDENGFFYIYIPDDLNVEFDFIIYDSPQTGKSREGYLAFSKLSSSEIIKAKSNVIEADYKYLSLRLSCSTIDGAIMDCPDLISYDGQKVIPNYSSENKENYYFNLKHDRYETSYLSSKYVDYTKFIIIDGREVVIPEIPDQLPVKHTVIARKREDRLIKGLIVDIATNTPISNARIANNIYNAISDENGSYEIIMREGINQYRVSASGYYEKLVEFDEKEQDSEYTIFLASYHEMYGKVTINGNDIYCKLINIRYCYNDGENNKWFTGLADLSGNYSIPINTKNSGFVFIEAVLDNGTAITYRLDNIKMALSDKMLNIDLPPLAKGCKAKMSFVENISAPQDYYVMLLRASDQYCLRCNILVNIQETSFDMCEGEYKIALLKRRDERKVWISDSFKIIGGEYKQINLKPDQWYNVSEEGSYIRIIE